MILETVFQWACNFILGLFSAFDVLSLPLDLISTLYTILCYGTWVVGVDVLLLVSGSIIFWLTFKAGTGLVLWLWKLLPLT